MSLTTNKLFSKKSPEARAKHLQRNKENRQRPEKKVASSIKSRERYKNLSNTKKYELNQKIIQLRRDRTAKLSVEDREKRRLEMDARERERQGKKRAEERAKKGELRE